MPPPRFVPALTWRSVALSLIGLCFCGWVVATATGPLGWQRAAGVGALAMGPLAFLGLVLLVNGVWGRFSRSALLSKAELLCLVYLLLGAAPFMGLGFWVPAISMASAPERHGAWELVDLFPEAFTPSGPNLLAPENIPFEERLEEVSGTSFVDNATDPTPTLVLRASGPEGAAARIPLRLVEDGLFYNASYLFSARTWFEGPETVSWSLRMVPDAGAGASLELIRGRGPANPDWTGPENYTRGGNYGFTLPPDAKETLFLEMRLSGPGELRVTEPLLVETTALTQFFEGRPTLSASEFAALPASQQAGVSVRPDNLVSLDGLAYLLKGRIPWEFWSRPLFSWLGFFLLLFGGTFAVAVIMRRQWLDRERFPMPLTYPVVDLIGRPDTVRRAIPAVARSGLFWGGFAIAALYAATAIGYAFNPSLPDPQPVISMRSYFVGGDWGDMWKFSLQILPLVFAVGLLLDLNISLSVVVGFLLYRLQFWLGAQAGWAADSDFPYTPEQFSGAALAYGLILLFFARRHILATARVALRGPTKGRGKGDDETGSDEHAADDAPFGYRFGYGLLVLSSIGFLLWCTWLGLGILGALTIYGVLLLLAFVLMRVRAECGVPYAIVGNHISALVLVPVAGGLGYLGAEGFGMNYILGGIILGATILVVAGLQVEFLELARRYRVRRWHIPAILGLAVVGGVTIGGWFFLTAHYAVGADNATHATQYDIRSATFSEMSGSVAEAKRAATGEQVPPTGSGKETSAFLFGGGVMVVLTVLRQIFAGFWFHPVGFLVGPYMETLWGGLLLAWLVRLIAVKMGGASTVRDKLRPFAVGLIAGLALFYLIGFAINLYVAAANPGQDLFFWKMTPNM